MNETAKGGSDSLFGRWVGAILLTASQLDRVAMGMLRAALVLVLVWIGGLKFVNFPYLSGIGRLIVKDFIMLAAAVVTLADSARTALNINTKHNPFNG